MPTLLFWNTGKQEVSGLIAVLARDIRADIVVLAECEMPVAVLLRELNSGGAPYYYLDPGKSSRLISLSLYPNSVASISDTIGITVRHYTPPIGASFLVAAVHLPSKRFQGESDQIFLSTKLAQTVGEAEKRVKHSRTIVLGDFNMNPFEPGMIAAGGFHATMDRRIALQETRTVQREEYSFFYNPMWSHLGDYRGVPGTYFYNKTSPVNFFWNTFDQIIIRPSVIPAFSDESIQIVTRIGDVDLLNSVGRPNAVRFSDHLPIAARLRDLKED